MLDRHHASAARRVLALLLLVALAPACTNDKKSHAPALSGLVYSPTTASQNSGGGSVLVGFSVDVADAGADISALLLALRDPSGTQIGSEEVALQNPAGVTSATLSGSAAIPTTTMGTYTLALRLRDSIGAESNTVEATVTITEAVPAPVVTGLSPSSAEAGTSQLTLTVTGTGFDATSYITWAGAYVTTTYVDATTLRTTLSSQYLTTAATVPVGVHSYASVSSNTLPFTVTPAAPRPVPVLTGLAPASADAGTLDLEVTVTGSNFHPASVVTVSPCTSYVPVSFVSASEVRFTLSSYCLQSPGTIQVSVVTPAPGGGTTASLDFTVTVPPIPGATVLPLPSARDMAFDPFTQKLYLAFASTAPTAANGIAVVDPFTGALEGSVDGGSEPGPLAISDDGQFLYLAHGGSSDVTRFTLPGLTEDLSIPLGRDASAGPYLATGLGVAPGAPETVAVALTAGYMTATAIFDGATARAGRGAGSTALCWGGAASTLYATGLYSGDLGVYAVTASGLGTPTVYRSAFSSGSQLQFDAGTGLLYSADGRAVDPATGGLDGTYALGYVYSPAAMVPDSSLGTAFFAYAQDYNSPWLALHPFDLTRYVPGTPTALPYLAAPALRLARFGPDGLAILTPARLVLLRGPAVLPVATSANPAPTISSLQPSTVAAGAGNLRLRVQGTGFVPGTRVTVGGVERFTRRLGATALEVYLPRSALASAAGLEVIATSPAPGGGTSAAMTLTVSP